ncbi:urease accessory protein UreF [Hymenobacter sp. GOD-10R]|uniref:urease accessory protein UreF n=1 Tax=Hymenobacter sp. GOD-10R TaxID=3093922 RepID=UPI002D7940A4|nr:urease accessory UreF family protein [Hymenobacter sp. GOD-10R]WRQ29961.1 urease accessory UreF family protein [Hymenobacter sp. GOD-10R]
MTQFARLLHLVDSAIPTGSFAYSYGLESSITFGLLKTPFGLRNYLYSYLQQVASMELPFINSCGQLAPANLGSELRDVVEAYDAMMLVPTLHRASLVQGKNWLKLLESFYPAAQLQDLGAWFAAQELPLHFTLVFALALTRAGFAVADLQTMYLHMALRDQLSAAIRLGFVGPMAGHQLQHDFYTIFEELLTNHAHKEHHEACRSAFLLDAAQILHEDIYSKLFQN